MAEPQLPADVIERAARALAHTPWEHAPEDLRRVIRAQAERVLSAALAGRTRHHPERGAVMAKTNQNHASVGHCRACEKSAYPSRRAARRAARVNFPGEQNMSAYPCPNGGGLYHFGHRPAGGRDLIRWRQARPS